MNIRRSVGACFVAAALCASAARADDAVALEVDDCAGVSGASVRALVALEVAPSALLPSSARAATRGGLECRGDTARIFVESDRRATPLRLEIRLLDLAPQARPRFLALAIAELIATSRLAAAPIDPAEAQPAPAPSDETTEANTDGDEQADSQLTEAGAPAVVRSHFEVWLGLGASREAEPIVWAPSVALGAWYAHGAWAITTDLRFDRGRRRADDVDLGVDTGSLALGPAWHLQGTGTEFLLGPSVRVGYASLHGTARSTDVTGDSLAGFWFGPCAQAALHVQLARRWSLRAGLEIGVVTQTLRGFDARGAELFALDGTWLSAHAGVSWGAAP